MKFKLDENFGTRTQKLFGECGHDVQTVREERLQEATDSAIYMHCCNEQRCLITLDLDFADVLRFPPEWSGGIVVFRLPANPSLHTLEQLTRQLFQRCRKRAAASAAVDC